MRGDTITALDHANGIDAYIVDTIFIGGRDYLNGSTVIRSEAGLKEAGSIIAAKTKPSDPTHRDPSDLARSLAHEIGHYLLNTSDHDPHPWNLMRDGQSPSLNNSDLTIGQRNGIVIDPATANGDDN